MMDTSLLESDHYKSANKLIYYVYKMNYTLFSYNFIWKYASTLGVEIWKLIK